MTAQFGTPATFARVLAQEWPDPGGPSKAGPRPGWPSPAGVLLGAVNAFPAAEFTARADASHAHFQAALNAAELESYEAASAATDDLFPEPDPSGLYILDLSVAPKARRAGPGRGDDGAGRGRGPATEAGPHQP